MATLGSVRITKRPPPANVMMRNINDQIKRELIPVGKEHVEERNKVVSNFETKIEFGYRISATEKQVTLTVVVENSSDTLADSDWTVGELWRALDTKGTIAHPIPKTPKQNGRLAFMWGGPGSYQPKTRPIARSGGPGRVNRGEMVFRKQVNHPGFKPRQFSKVINKRLDKRFTKAIDRGVRLGSRKRR